MKCLRSVRKGIAGLLVAAILLTICPAAFAEENGMRISVYCNDQAYPLEVIQEDEIWYANISNLAAIGKCGYEINQGNKTAFLYKQEPFVVLYSLGLSDCILQDGGCYVPLQAASVAAGIRFSVKDRIMAEVLRTPAQMLAELDGVFFDQRYQITQLLLTDGYWIAETAARAYAMLPFVGSGSLVGTLSGSDETQRYRRAFSSILSNSGSTSSFLIGTADLSNEIADHAKILKAVTDLLQKDGALYRELLRRGVSPKALDVILYESDSYDSLDGLFEEWSTVLGTINFSHFLDVCAFYAVSVDTEESILVAMKRVFENSNNKNSRKAVELLINARYGNGGAALADIYGDMVWNLTMEYINDHGEKLLYGSSKDTIGLAARGIDTVFQASDKSEAYLYFPIYASIQQDLYNYYQAHRNDTTQQARYDLRAVAIMYLKAAIAAYDYASFDRSLTDTLATANAVLNRELANVLSYGEQEIMPTYTNQEIVLWLDSRHEAIAIPDMPVETAPPQNDNSEPVETLSGQWVYEWQDEYAEAYQNVLDLRKDGTLSFWLATVNGHVWGSGNGYWRIKSMDGQWYILEIRADRWGAELGDSIPATVCTADIAMRLDGNTATFQLISGEFPDLYYNRTFYRVR